MSKVVFVDTSILCEVLRVPGKSQQHQAVTDELRARVTRGETLVLPTASIIETGNHIAQLEHGDSRRERAHALTTFLRATAKGEAPWRLHGAVWDGGFLTSICDGPASCLSFPDMAAQKIGAGDVSVLAEAEHYRTRVASVTVEVWTLDAGLMAYT
ncbi:MAG: hypothetical protein J2O48_03150 [Solirubrobacterales bacterium]|nr:hypothetical protein [Solirubrobacterales bacterium]